MDPRKKAEALTRLIEDGHPDSGVTVTPESDGARITISGPKKAPGLSGPGNTIDVELRLGDNSPLLLFMLANRVNEDSRTDEDTPA
jgi:hypothetical protein